jgi:hypothetical protein
MAGESYCKTHRGRFRVPFKTRQSISDQVDLKMLYALCFIELIHPIMDHQGDP